MRWRTVGHEKQVWFLRRSFEEKRLFHAYLFLGPEGVGKKTLALDFASLLNCNSEEPPCDVCSTCNRIKTGVYPDVLIIQPIQKEIGIDQIRDVIELAYLPPYDGRYKVFIIEEAESLSPEAGNCLLKTLEEPPAGVIFILLAQDEVGLLPTIVSRCCPLQLTPLPKKTVIKFLKEHHGFSEGEAEFLACLCRGCLGKANDEFIKKRGGWIKDINRLFPEGAILGERFALADELSQSWDRDRRLVLDELSFWQGWWHDLLLFKAGLPHLLSNIDLIDMFGRFSGHFSFEQIKEGLESTRKAIRYLKLNAHPRLVFYTLMLSLPK